jgi:Asp-tRNA(Asn)/Glu-tRNA(Gln) amidotransferase A subunit family amidase
MASLRPYSSRAPEFRSGSYTPRDYLEESISLIEATEHRLHAFPSLRIDRARLEADAASERWKSGAELSPLDGAPLGVKDIIDVAGMVTGMGSPTMSDYRPPLDAAAVFALKRAGMVVVGKTTTTEFATSYPCDTRNPHDYTRTSGGSSAGSAAAVGAGILPVALGTQVVGSTIRPAGYCGTYGLKTSAGLLNRGGVHDYYLSQSTLGILAAGSFELGYALAALFEGAGSDPGVVLRADPADGAQAGGPPSRVGLLAPLAWEQADSAARQALLNRTTQWQREGVDVVTDDAALRELNALLHDTLPLTRKINAYESRPYLEAIAARDRDGLSLFALQRIADGQGIGRAEYHDAVQERAGLRRAFAKLSERYSAFVTLSAGGVAPVGTASTGDPAMSAMASILGCPAISLPLCELDGLPLGVQLIGRYGFDFDLLSLARWVVDVNRPTPSSVPT